MPKTLVEENRLLYKNRFVTPTLNAHPRLKDSCLLDIPAYYQEGSQEYGFKGYKINVDLSEERQARSNVLSVCTVWKDEKHEDMFHGLIQVAKGFSELPISKRKFILAHEWLHIMMGFKNKEPFKLVSNRSDTIMKLYASSGKKVDSFLAKIQEAYWKDDYETMVSMSSALNHLLVSKDSIEIILNDDFGLNWAEFKTSIAETANSLEKLFIPLVVAFSKSTNTGAELVFERIREMLFKS